MEGLSTVGPFNGFSAEESPATPVAIPTKDTSERVVSLNRNDTYMVETAGKQSSLQCGAGARF